MPYNYMFEPYFDDGRCRLRFSQIVRVCYIVYKQSFIFEMLGINSPRTTLHTHEELPSSRLLGNYMADFCNNISCAYTDSEHTQISVLAAMFGQLVAHDCSGRATAVVKGNPFL